MEMSERAALAVGIAVSWLVTAVFIHMAASPLVKGKQRFVQALVSSGIGSVLAGLILIGVGFRTLGIVLALGAWALVLAGVYRTSWLRGAVIGAVAWVLWSAVNWILQQVLVAQM